MISDDGIIRNQAKPNVLGGHPLWGAIFETAVVLEIRKQAEVLSTRPNFYHWRAHSGAKVDLIIELNGKYFPIEIKGKSHPKKGDVSGIKAFREAYSKLNIGAGLVICTCSSIFPLSEQDYALPWNIALVSKGESIIESVTTDVTELKGSLPKPKDSVPLKQMKIAVEKRKRVPK